MKRILLALTLTISLTSAAQHNWAAVESSGFGREITFWMSQTFQGKLYVAGDSMGHISLHSSSTGAQGSFTEETGILPLLQPSNESNFCSSTSNANNMFLASSTNFDTTGGFTGIKPQVYRYDGSSYTLHGTLNYAALPDTNKLVSGNYPSLQSIIQYSPDGLTLLFTRSYLRVGRIMYRYGKHPLIKLILLGLIVPILLPAPV